MKAQNVPCPTCGCPTTRQHGAFGMQQRTCTSPSCTFSGRGVWKFEWIDAIPKPKKVEEPVPYRRVTIGKQVHTFATKEEYDAFMANYRKQMGWGQYTPEQQAASRAELENGEPS